MGDKELLEKLKKGDNKAFRQFVSKYHPIVFNTCIGFVHDKDNADDLSQEVFIEVHRSLEKFRGDSKISTWVYRIAVNKSLNFIRDRKKHSVLQSIDTFFSFGENIKRDIPDYQSPEDSMEQSENAIAIKIAIDSLPKNQKIAFVLSKYDDLSYKKIAEVMDISLSSVESLIHRAKKNLQKKLLNIYKK